MQTGFVTRWSLKDATDTSPEIAPDERLPWGKTIVLGIQHVVAMFGSTALAPIIMGFDPNTAIFFSGVGTLLFFLVTGGRLPSYLGSSFAFIAVVIAATGYAGSGPNPNIPVALGGIVAAGVVYAAIGLIVHFVRHRLGRAADAAGLDRRDRRGDRAEPRRRRREGRLGVADSTRLSGSLPCWRWRSSPCMRRAWRGVCRSCSARSAAISST